MFGPASARTPPDSVDGRRSTNDRVGNGSPEVATGKPDREQTLWTDAWRKAEERGEDECPICMGSMMPILATNKSEEEAPQEKGVIAANQELVRSPSNKETAATLSVSPRDRTTNVGVVEVGGDQDNRGEREGRGVAAGRQQLRQEEQGGGTTTAATERRRRKGRERRRRQTEVGDTDQRKRILLSCSHVFHKAVSPRGGFATPRTKTTYEVWC